jgi:hypothetical protein
MYLATASLSKINSTNGRLVSIIPSGAEGASKEGILKTVLPSSFSFTWRKFINDATTSVSTVDHNRLQM